MAQKKQKKFCVSLKRKCMKNYLKKHYVNIAEESSGTKPKTFGINFENTSVQHVRDIATSYKNHPSIIKVKQFFYKQLALGWQIAKQLSGQN